MLMVAINGKENFGRKMFCNGIIPLTPKKITPTLPSLPPAATLKYTLMENSLPVTSSCSAAESQGSPPAGGLLPALLSPIPYRKNQNVNIDFARRHSLSLVNRIPPENS